MGLQFNNSNHQIVAFLGINFIAAGIGDVIEKGFGAALTLDNIVTVFTTALRYLFNV